MSAELEDYTLRKVLEFHGTFDLPVQFDPGLCDPTNDQLRIELLREEVEELAEALEAHDLVKMLDALTDIQYVLDGAYLTWGLARMKVVAFDEVHDSNMTKQFEDGPRKHPITGKILKGPNYREPNLLGVLQYFDSSIGQINE
jgi:predicted HAD superfamily Cof-like phosphohydrolase